MKNRVEWTLEDEMDWAENQVRLQEDKMDRKELFDLLINITLMAVGLYALKMILTILPV